MQMFCGKTCGNTEISPPRNKYSRNKLLGKTLHEESLPLKEHGEKSKEIKVNRKGNTKMPCKPGHL